MQNILKLFNVQALYWFLQSTFYRLDGPLSFVLLTLSPMSGTVLAPGQAQGAEEIRSGRAPHNISWEQKADAQWITQYFCN